jgi:hypothetical protein
MAFRTASGCALATSDVRAGVNPIVERLILRCLKRDPRARPASVAQLAAALPGGDPLAAAIAAGETPSPELLIASGSREGLSPAIATALVALIIAGVLAFAAMNDRGGDHAKGQASEVSRGAGRARSTDPLMPLAVDAGNRSRLRKRLEWRHAVI